MRLYEINAELDALLEQVDPETGELNCDLDALEGLMIAREEKLEGLALAAKNYEAEAKMIREEEKTLAERRKRLENKAARAEAFLSEQLQGEKFQTARVAVNYRTSKSVYLHPEFMEWALKNNRYLRYKDPEPDKTAIANAIKAGESMPYAELIENRTMTIK